MKKCNNLYITKFLSGALLILAGVSLFGGCESFLASPTELFVTPTPAEALDFTPTPTANAAPTAQIKATNTPVPTATPVPTETPVPTSTPSPTVTPTPLPTVEPAPAAIVLSNSDITYIVNREYPIDETYTPSDLKTVRNCMYPGSSDSRYKLSSEAADAFDEMCDAAFAEHGLSIYGISGYRTISYQYGLYTKYLCMNGTKHTNYYSAVPKTSEHHTGLAMDVTCQAVSYDLLESFESTNEGIWLYENSYKYGFILRYPKDKVDITGYAYEPWHFRYVGKPLAYYLYTNDLTLEEYYGVPSSEDRSYLDKTPLIDTASTDFLKIHQTYFKNLGQILYTDDTKTVPVLNRDTLYPFIIPYVKSSTGSLIYDYNGNPITGQLITNYNGELTGTHTDLSDNRGCDTPGASCNLLLTRTLVTLNDFFPWKDSKGNYLWLDPIVNFDGNVATDSKGNVLYHDVLRLPDGSVWLDRRNNPHILTPVRDQNGNALLDANEKVVFHMPEFTNAYTVRTNSKGEPVYNDPFYSEDEGWDVLLDLNLGCNLYYPE